jgi:ABC-type nitrate/sulfonate/bicarbonate transport system permease component
VTVPTTVARAALPAAAGVALGLAVWETAGRLRLLGRSLPPASDVAAYLTAPGNRALLRGALSVTAVEALNGLVIGVAAALALAVVAALVPALRPGVGRLSAMVNAAPWIALGPVFAILYRQQTPAIIATLAVFFSCFVAFSTGLTRLPAAPSRIFDALGARPARRLVLLALPHAVPAVLDGLRLALPAALVGAVFGEWFGATRGLGALLGAAMQTLRTEQLWAAAVLAAGFSVVGYGAVSGLHVLARRRFA